MAKVTYDELAVCPHCGEETPNYEDCIMCGHSLQDPDALPRELDEDDIQKMMMDAKLLELKAKREILFADPWDHAPWLERLQRLVQIAPDNPRVHYYIGAAYTELKEYRKAIVSFTRSIIADPTMVDAIRRRGDCQSILVPVLSGDVQVYYDRALADYEAALALEPDAYTYNAHGSVIASLGKLDEAIEEYGQAVESNPDYPETYFNRGYAYKVYGEKDKAVADFEKFLSFDEHWNEEMISMAQSHIKELLEPD